MKRAVFVLTAVLSWAAPAALAGQAAVSASAPAEDTLGRNPAVYVSGTVGVDRGENVADALLAVEVPIGPLRASAAWGRWGLVGYTCLAAVPACHLGGPAAQLGMDLSPRPPRSRLQPFVGTGVALRFLGDTHSLQPLVRGGIDVRLLRWLGARLAAEWSRYPHEGSLVLWELGMRVGIPRSRR